MTGEFLIRDGILEAYIGRDELVEVPETVHTVGEGAFKACVSMKKVVLPPGLKQILGGAFKGCRKLEEAKIPAGVSYIGDYAFHRCHSLRKIVLPASVTELGDCVFLYCDGLREARIPGVRRLGGQVFVNDVLLEKLEVSEELEEECICDVFTGCGALREISFGDGRSCRIPNAVEVVAGELPVPKLVRYIAVDILRMMELEGRCLVTFRTNLKHVEIPEGIEQIGKSCFFDKRGILSVRLPGSLREIGSRAFRNCINLETVIFAGKEVSVHEDAFLNCSSLKAVCVSEGGRYEIEGLCSPEGKDIPETVRTIRRQVLGNFRISGTILLKYLGMESRVSVPKGITVIAEEAFAGNEAVDKVLLPESLQEIGAGAFRNCLLLQSVSFPEGIRRIGAGAFENCVKLLRARLPQGLFSVEERTFRKCRALKEITFGERLWKIGEQAFYGCSALGQVSFPDSLTWVGEMAFYRCGALKEIRLTSRTVHIGSLAFAQSGVRKAWMAGDGKNNGTGVFSGCTRLQSLVLEEGICHIADKMAYGCTTLRQISLPGSVKSVGINVFEGTLFLESWRRQAQMMRQVSEQPQGEISERPQGEISEQPLGQILEQPLGQISEQPLSQISEQNSEGEIFWDGRDLEGEIWLPETVRIVAGGAFYGNKKVTVIHLPKGVKWIGAAAFKGCSGLRRVYWPESADKLEAEVFSGCVSLEEVACSGSPDPEDGMAVRWSSVGDRAFYRCKNLKEICLAQTSDIGKEAFSGCIGLKPEQVCFKETGLWIGERAFEDTAFLATGENLPVVIGNIVVSGGSCSGEVRLQEGIIGIAPFGFAGNRKITRVILPESLGRIGEGAFWGCSGLEEVRFPKGSCRVNARAFEKCVLLREADVRAAQMGAGVFACCYSLKKAKISGISILAERLFDSCTNLEECICEDAQAVGRNCFIGCRSLQSFDLSHIYEVREYAFSGCDSLKYVEFSDETCVNPHGFEDCGGLEEIVLLGEQGKICLREYGFSGCTALKQVRLQGREWILDSYSDILSEKIPEMIRMIFHSALSCFTVNKEEILTGYRGAGRKVRIPRGIRRIEAEVFRDVLMLEEIEIPESVEYIGARAFHGTAWMSRQRQVSPMVTVNHMLLDASGCAGEVTVPEDIRMVCGWAFANGLEIKRIHLQSAGVRVEEFAFRNCIYLEEIILPDGVRVRIKGIEDREKELPALAKQAVIESMNCFKTDERGVLLECTGNISRLRLAEGITAVGEGAFQDGNLLTEITLPSTVRVIGKRAFAGCKWLRQVRGAENVREIGDMAFFGCGALEKVALSGHFQRLGVRAFENCTSLQEILLPEGMEEIPEKAFYRCHSLREVVLPSSLKRIGRDAFAFCRELSENPSAEGLSGGRG